MTEITDYVLATLSQAQRRAEVASQNLANTATPAYKRKLAFSTLVTNAESGKQLPEVRVGQDDRPGKLIITGNPSDFAIAGPGYFAFAKDGDQIFRRQAQLMIDHDGRLVDDQGFSLQLANGNALIVKSSSFEVHNDGIVTDGGQVLGKIAVYHAVPEQINALVAVDGRAPQPQFQLLSDANILQGVIESSNVVTGDEMVVMMESLRRAEAGQRLMSTYDELMGRVISSFGEVSR